MTGTRVEPDRALETGSEAGLQFRLWIGQNPVLFVLACLLAGYLVGRTMGSNG